MLGRLHLRRRFEVYTRVVNRHNQNVTQNLHALTITLGDTLLLEGAAEDIKRLAQEFAVAVISQLAVQLARRRHAPIAFVTILGLVLMANFGLTPLFVLSLVAAAILLVTRTIDAEEAFAFVQGRLLVLIVSMLAIRGVTPCGRGGTGGRGSDPRDRRPLAIPVDLVLFPTDLIAHRTGIK